MMKLEITQLHSIHLSSSTQYLDRLRKHLTQDLITLDAGEGLLCKLTDLQQKCALIRPYFHPQPWQQLFKTQVFH